jgi:hypothetical protein
MGSGVLSERYFSSTTVVSWWFSWAWAAVCAREIPRPAEVRRDFGMTPWRRNREDFRLATTLSSPRRGRASLDRTAEGGCPHINPSPNKPSLHKLIPTRSYPHTGLAGSGGIVYNRRFVRIRAESLWDEA